MFGNPETTPGGLALKFYSSVRLDVRKIETLKAGELAIGSRVRVRVVKNKVAPPLRVAEFDILGTDGISVAGGLIDVATELGILERKGSFYNYGGKVLAQGREGARTYINENPKFAEELEHKIREEVDKGKKLPKEIGEEVKE
jgi:recombination protein RecA